MLTSYPADLLSRKKRVCRLRVIRTSRMPARGLRIQHVARLSDGGDQRVVDPGVVMAVPLRFRLGAVDLDGGAVDVERDGRQPFALIPRPAISSIASRRTLRLAGSAAIAVKRDSVRCDSSPESSSGGCPTAELVARRKSGSWRSTSASPWPRQPCAARSPEVRIRKARSCITSSGRQGPSSGGRPSNDPTALSYLSHQYGTRVAGQAVSPTFDPQ